MNTSNSPDSPDIRHRLIQAAAEAFMEEGYRASIDRIAERAGVARQTIYNHFQSKEDLFSEVAAISAEHILISLDACEENLRDNLLRFATALRERVLGEQGLAMFRAVSAEAARLPALGRAYFEKGPGQTANRLALFLDQAMKNGDLRQDNPRFAAELFLSMLTGFTHAGLILNRRSDFPVADQSGIAHIVDCFLRAFDPEVR